MKASDVEGKIVVWYRDKYNFGIARVKDFFSDGGVLTDLEDKMVCFDTDVISILDENAIDEYSFLTAKSFKDIK